jgi:SPP1 gp7 family putative phage head morphogenesis protein
MPRFVKDEAAQKAAARQVATMVREVSAETRAGIRALIRRTTRDKVPPAEAARLVQSMVGLTSKQMQSVMNVRARLVAQGVSPESISRRMKRLIAKKTRERARAIAETETMAFLNYGHLHSMRQDGTAEKQVVCQLGACSRVCRPACGQVRPVDEPFRTGIGQRMAPPFHPHCRCTIKRRRARAS